MGRPHPPAKALRIVYVTSSRGVGGGEQLVLALLAAGRERGWDQTVLNLFSDAHSVALAQRCAPTRYEAREGSDVLGVPAMRSWLAGRLAEIRPDIVHVTLFHASVLTATVRRHGERRLLTHMYGEGLAQLAHPRTRMRLDRWAARRYDHVSAISDAVKSFLEDSYGFPPPAVGRIRLGWSGEPPPKKPPADRPPTIVCVAGLRREKGHDTLLAAFKKVRHEIPEARLVLVGDGPHRQHVEGAVRAAGLEQSVRLTGATTDIWPHLADADVFALASPSEALGIAIMEAMAAGLPVVASDVGGIPELVTPGVTGELFPVRDHDALAFKLTALLRSPHDLARMSAAARGAAASMHMDQTVGENLRLYERLLEPGEN